MNWILLSGALFLIDITIHADITFELSKKEPYLSEPDEIYIGKKNVLLATATFTDDLPGSSSGVDVGLVVSISNTVFALGEVISFTVGSALAITSESDGTDITSSNYETYLTRTKGPEYEDTSMKIRYDTAASFGLWTVAWGTIGSGPDNQVVIEFEVVYVSLGGNAADTLIWTSGGMGYADGSYIWISQLSYILKDTVGSVTASPEFSIVPDSNLEIAIDTPLTVELSMKIPNPASSLIVNAMVLNDTTEDIFVQSMNLTSVGSAYGYCIYKENIYSFGYSTCPLSTSLNLDLGTPVNKESQEDTPVTATYELKVDITFQLVYHVLVGKVNSLGFGVEVGGAEVWVSDIDVTVVQGGPVQMDTVSVSVSVKDDQNMIPAGSLAVAEVILITQEKSNLQYTFTLTTSSSATNALSILSITPRDHGTYIPCSIPTSAVDITLTETTPDSGLFDSATWTVNILNTGVQTDGLYNSSSYKFDIYAMMLPSAVEDDTHTLTVNVSPYSGSDTSLDFVVNGTAPYMTDVNYTFILENNCGAAPFPAGSTVMFQFTIETHVGMAGPMTTETPIPADLVTSNLKFKSARVVSKGINVVCVEIGDIIAVVSDWVNGSGEQDRAVLTIPMVCNVQLVNDSAEDKFVIEIKVTIKDNISLLVEDTTQAVGFGVGSELSGTQIWVANYWFDTQATIDLGTTKRITGVRFENGNAPTTWPGDIMLQWSGNNRVFVNNAYTWDAGIEGTDDIVYSLDSPLYARYVRLVNTDGQCTTIYTFVTEDFGDDIVFYGDSQSQEIMKSNIMYLLDGDVSTCMPLPTSAENVTAKYYWTTISTTVLKADGGTAFNLQLTGNGITCDNRTDPQVTMVMYPKDSSTLKFEGKRNKCKLKTPSETSCTYECACSDTVTCADVSLLLYYIGTPSGDYEICDVKIVP